jgi:hypothetical protein
MREGLERKPWFSIDACWRPKRINCLSRTLVTLKDEMHIKCPSSSTLQKTTIWRLPKEREIGTTVRLKRVLVTFPFPSHPSSRFELTRRRS